MKSQVEFFEEVISRLKILDLTVADLSREIGFTRTAFYNWASGEVKISYESVVQISHFLKIKEDYQDLHDINEHRLNLLLKRRECAAMMQDLYAKGVSVDEIATTFLTTPKMAVKIIQKNYAPKRRLKG